MVAESQKPWTDGSWYLGLPGDPGPRARLVMGRKVDFLWRFPKSLKSGWW